LLNDLLVDQEVMDCGRSLCALADPISNAFGIEFNGAGLGARVVGAQEFEVFSLSISCLFRHNHPVRGLAFLSNAAKTEHEHIEELGISL